MKFLPPLRILAELLDIYLYITTKTLFNVYNQFNV
jgi:hypothetical protein